MLGSSSICRNSLKLPWFVGLLACFLSSFVLFLTYVVSVSFTPHFHVQPEFSSQSSLVWKNPPEIASWKAPLDTGFQVPFSMCQGGFPLVF